MELDARTVSGRGPISGRHQRGVQPGQPVRVVVHLPVGTEETGELDRLGGIGRQRPAQGAADIVDVTVESVEGLRFIVGVESQGALLDQA